MQMNASSFQPTASSSDVWHYTWGKTIFKATDYYRFFFKEVQSHQVFGWLWKSKCMMKLNVFAWLLINDRLNTRNMLKRRHYNIGENHACILCGQQTEETLEHLFFECNFSVRIWNYLQVTWPPGDDMSMQDNQDFAKPFFTEVVFVACRNIWIIRNARVFRHERQSLNKWRSAFIHYITHMQHRVKATYKAELLKWISFLPP